MAPCRIRVILKGTEKPRRISFAVSLLLPWTSAADALATYALVGLRQPASPWRSRLSLDSAELRSFVQFVANRVQPRQPEITLQSMAGPACSKPVPGH